MGRVFASIIPTNMMVLLCIACSTSGITSANADGSANNTFVFLDAGPATPESPDGGASCIGDCNYQTQQGCASGQMCLPQLNDAGTNVTAQCLAAGSKAAGELCARPSDCQPGLICRADERCHHLCCGDDWSVCASNESCTGTVLLQPVNDAGIPVGTPAFASVSVCEPVDDCDVLNPNSCPAGESCYIVDSRADVKCLPTGTVPLKGGCTSTELCVAGFTCVQDPNGSKGGSICTRLCRAVTGGAEPYCPTSEGYCAHFVRDPPDVGECTPTSL